MSYMNYLGQEIGLISHPAAKKVKPDPEPFHKGWRVVGVPAGELQKARDAHKKAAPKNPFDQDAWLMVQKQKPVRAKPYALRAAASDCAALATKSGWLRVEVVEIKRGEAPKRAALMAKGAK